MPYERGPMPDLTDAEREALRQADRERSEAWEREKARWHLCTDPECTNTGPHGGLHYHRTEG